ncbi:YhgE/Pip domain-containing protein [Streptomyces sp. RB6PN25]|uniref:YhgE/Pip domain-containing protein n=1 Tax=Streptomyces humicola TaxID=2953240 RepID=A0ABT1PX29_9ACTN|nr:YhgE/Pip domain-containing protein [Streptomyces humicola]MCQ4081535.1 YhgE/Pip domain-containing protein [Streptomyces humicola]
MRTPRLAALELRKFGRGRLPRAAMAALLLLPLLYGALYLCSFWDPYGRLNKIPVALVNADRGATVDGRKVTAGDTIAANLRTNTSSFDWQVTDAAHAAKGVEDGTYYLSLTIPADFSSRVASASGTDPETGALQVRTNDANNYIVGQISRTVFSEVRAAASANASRSFYDNIFVAFSDIHDRTQQAAQGADDLSAGIGAAKDGAGQLADGLGTAKQGSSELASKMNTLATGLGTLDTGAADLASGTRSAARGTQELADQANAIAGKAGPFLNSHSKEIGDAAQLVADASQTIAADLGTLPADASQAASDAQSAHDKLATTYTQECEGPLPMGTDCPALKQAVDAAKEVADVARNVDALVQQNTSSLTGLRNDLEQVHAFSQQLAEEAPHLSSDLDTAVSKINALNAGVHEIADGADVLHSGLATAKSGSDALTTGAGSLDSGIGRLSTGAQSLDGGLYKLSDGSGRLASGLKNGVAQIPDYDKQQRDARSAVMSDPVQLAAQALHKAPNYGTGFAPYFIPLSLWVGAMVSYMLLQPLSKRALSAGAPGWRIALAGWLPVAAIGIAQTAALMAVLHWGLGLQMVRAAGTIGFLSLVTCCFAAIVQWLGARFGPAGRVLVLALLMLQLTSAGGTYPVQTSPGFFNWIHPFLPMSYVVDGLRHLITGGELWPVWRACLVLLAFTAGALALTTWTARRKQVWTVDRLHPELTL